MKTKFSIFDNSNHYINWWVLVPAILLAVLVVCFICLRSSFAYYELKEELSDAIVLKTMDLNYTFTNLDTNNTVTVPASGEQEITITLNTQNPIEMKYQLYYLYH